MSLVEKVSASRRHLMAAVGVLVTAMPGDAEAGGGRGGHGHGHGGHGHGGHGHGGHGQGGGGHGGGGVHCLLKGTRIMTPAGERAIEGLRAGELVSTASGQCRPVQWVGKRVVHRETGGAFAPGTMPVRVAQAAFAPNVPHADVILSPEHAVYHDGMLVPVAALVNGTTIACAQPSGETIEYFHILLDTHDVVMAAGLPVETLYLPVGHGVVFDNADGFPTALVHMTRYAPVTGATGRRAAMRSHLRSAMAPWLDRRTACDKLRDALDERGRRLRSIAA